MQPKKKSVVPVIAGSLVVLVVLVIVVLATHKSSDAENEEIADDSGTLVTGGSDQPVDTDGPVDEETNLQSVAATESSFDPQYKDGTYTATGNYMAPSGAESIGVTLTLKDDVITDVSVKTGSQSAIALQFQQAFASGYKTLVVGKNIADVQLGAVSGSSLTPKGFNDALAKIEVEAKA